MKKDKYSKARGGWSRTLDISCAKCGQHVCYYQKDGPGPLKRTYVDRIINTMPTEKVFICNNCGHELGTRTIYQKENRPAYELFPGSVKKKIIKQSVIK